MKLEAVIGLEIHVQLKTKSKMFCSCANILGEAPPNTAICPICMGYPGTLPVPNKTAIEWTQKTGAALDCVLALESKFDRKSYFYPDLPKGYQISQYDQPFVGSGLIDLVVDGQTRAIGIERIHLEEDAAKNTHPSTNSGQASYTLIDFNRAGTPLMEIVTKPDLCTPNEAKILLQELQRILRAIGVSDADMEKGQMRCDANVSLREQGSRKLHPKTEIKNLNSFRFVEKALAYEIDRQTKIWQTSGPLNKLSTRGFDAKKGITYEQRTKEEAADYRYFPEPDIPTFTFSTDYLAGINAGIPELPSAKKARFMRQLGVSDQHAQLFVDKPLLANFYEAVVSEIQQLDNDLVEINPSELPGLNLLAAKIILRQLREQILPGQKNNISPANFAELVVLVYQGRINKSVISQVIEAMQKTGGDPDHIIQNLGLSQVSDMSDLENLVNQTIEQNPDVVVKIKAGKSRGIQYLMGQVMAKSGGTANPEEVLRILKTKLA